MENAFIVRGGKPLKGKTKLTGAKNISLKVMIAALLFEKPTSFINIPKLSDIQELIHLIRATGAHIDYEGDRLIIDPTNMNRHEVDLLHATKIRVSFMLFAPFMHRFGEAVIPNPGGCRIGARPIDRIVELMKAFGVVTRYDSDTGYYTASLNGGGR